MCPWVGPHAPSFERQLWGAAQPCGVSLTTRGIAPACLRYDRLTLVACVAGPLCLAGDPLLDCVPARLSPVASIAPGDLCHGLRCSLAGLGPVPLEYRSCHWPRGSAGSPQCVRPMGYWFFPVPRPPYVCAVSWAVGLLFTGVPARFAVVRLRCPGPAGSCSPVCSLGVLCCMCGPLSHWAPVHRCACCVRCAYAMGGCVPLPPPLTFVFFFFLLMIFFFFKKKQRKTKKRKTGARVHVTAAVKRYH